MEPALVPELLVADIDRSIAFWCDLCGFSTSYSRPDEKFAYIVLGSARLMLEQAGVSRNWVTGPLEHPLGRGINFQITVPDSGALAAVLDGAGVECSCSWRRSGTASGMKRPACSSSSFRILTAISSVSSLRPGGDRLSDEGAASEKQDAIGVFVRTPP